MPINKPKHLEVPNEITVEGKRVHVYEATATGKRDLESLIWLCAHYHYVNLVPVEDRIEFHCRIAFGSSDIDLDE